MEREEGLAFAAGGCVLGVKQLAQEENSGLTVFLVASARSVLVGSVKEEIKVVQLSLVHDAGGVLVHFAAPAVLLRTIVQLQPRCDVIILGL